MTEIVASNHHSDYSETLRLQSANFFDIDPLARLLRSLRLVGSEPPGSLILPGAYFLIYFLFADVLLPLILGRFSSSHSYVGPFDPRLIPNRIVDALFVPVLVYYYGQVSVLFPSLFDRLQANGVFGSRKHADSNNTQFHYNLYRRWMQSVWMYPLVFVVTFLIGVQSAFDYFGPQHTPIFINSDRNVFVFNLTLWMLNYYMIAAIAMRYVLFTGWLIQLHRKQAVDKLSPDVLCVDNRMGFSPITECVVTAAKIFTVALLVLVLVIRGNENVGHIAASPDWLAYLGVLVASVPVVVLPIYLVHRIMLKQKERLQQEFEDETSYPHTSWVLQHWNSLGEEGRTRWQAAQLVFLRFSQVKDWPVTVEEAATVFFTYLLGTVFTILSTLQTIIQFLR